MPLVAKHSGYTSALILYARKSSMFFTALGMLIRIDIRNKLLIKGMMLHGMK